MRSLADLSEAEIISGRLAPLALATGTHDTPAVRAHARDAAARDLAMTAALRELLDIAKQPLLVCKGAAIGPLYYDSPSHRPRLDIDVWVDGWGTATQLADTMRDVGYAEVHQLPGVLARHAIAMRRGEVSVDVHAVCSRRVRLARALPFEAVWDQRLAVEHADLRFDAPAHHHHWLLLAAHFTAHHAGQDVPAIQCEDLRRIAEHCDDAAWQEIVAIAREHELVSALSFAAEQLARWDAPPLIAALLTGEDESASWRHPLLSVLDDLSLLPAADQARYAAELLYPPSTYLHHHYEITRPRPRALLAFHRLAESAVRAILSRRASTDAA